MTKSQSLVVGIISALSALGAATPGFGGVDISDLRHLSRDEQRGAVRDALAARCEALKNLECVSRTEVQQHEWFDGTSGKPAAPGTRSEFHLKRLNGSYWLSARLFSNERPSVPDIVSKSNFDAEEGRSRGLMLENGGKKGLFGRIDAKMDDTITLSRAAYYVADFPGLEERRFCTDLLAEAKNWTVSLIPEKDEVVISYPYKHPVLSKYGVKGSWNIIFNAGRGMAPVRLNVDYRVTVDGREIWREETVSMDDMREVDGIWIPFSFQSRVRSSSLGDRKCVLESTEIESASLGGVSQEDLLIEFPEGTFVTDAVQGVSYKVGPDGEPLGKPKPFHQPDALTADVATGESGLSKMVLLLVINGALLGAAVVVLVARRTRRGRV